MNLLLGIDQSSAEITLRENITRTILIIFFIVLWIFCGFAAGRTASEKGRQGIHWYVLGFLFGLFAVLAALALKSVGNRGVVSTWRCPSCGAENSIGNTYCGQCGANASNKSASGWRCESCGAQNNESAKYCQKCGKKMTVLQEHSKDELKPLVNHAKNVDGAFQYKGGHILNMGNKKFDINSADKYDWIGSSVYCNFGDTKIEILFDSIYQAQAFYNKAKK